MRDLFPGKLLWGLCLLVCWNSFQVLHKTEFLVTDWQLLYPYTKKIQGTEMRVQVCERAHMKDNKLNTSSEESLKNNEQDIPCIIEFPSNFLPGILAHKNREHNYFKRPGREEVDYLKRYRGTSSLCHPAHVTATTSPPYRDNNLSLKALVPSVGVWGKKGKTRPYPIIVTNVRDSVHECLVTTVGYSSGNCNTVLGTIVLPSFTTIPYQPWDTVIPERERGMGCHLGPHSYHTLFPKKIVTLK